MIEIHQLPALEDNYIYMLRDSATGLVAAVDPTKAKVVREFLEARGWKLDIIFNTHHHDDHIGGNLALKDRYQCAIYGNAKDASRIPGISKVIRDGDEFLFGETKVKVLAADGHTRGHIVYWFADDRALFCGDVIFSLGCGKLFEGTPEEMWSTLSRLRDLPDETRLYCAHEYTLENSVFALRMEPGNTELQARVAEVKRLRAEGKSTIPSTVAMEKATNPFLRPESQELRTALRFQGAPALSEVFARTRSAKDRMDNVGKNDA